MDLPFKRCCGLTFYKHYCETYFDIRNTTNVQRFANAMGAVWYVSTVIQARAMDDVEIKKDRWWRLIEEDFVVVCCHRRTSRSCLRKCILLKPSGALGKHHIGRKSLHNPVLGGLEAFFDLTSYTSREEEILN